MTSFKLLCVFVLFGACLAQPAKQNIFKEMPVSDLAKEMKASCDGNDAIACMKFKVMSFLDMLFKKDNFQVSENVEISRNSYSANEVDGRSDGSFLDSVEKYLKGHDVSFKMPFGESKVKISPRNLDNDELDISVKFEDDVNEAKSSTRKSKLKKIVLPILVFIMLKALTLIPLALGVLSIKAWNALQLSFFSFVVSLAMAVFQLCKKIASDHHAPQIAAHGPWDQQYARSLGWSAPAEPKIDAQNLAYNAYA
ncbi:uncharacterized protein LOC113376655 [Ctenocephalides felis]|uniref:uncharacterized protein LOC113376655 n=1 Tax=Ctenocephalides felis TaxID=7515 RepID=UPI000E6E2FA3|nr:uncharacterized protein LOC113376655 [Ctenocephalides felis]